MFAVLFTASFDTRFADPAGVIVREAAGEFRLAAIQFNHPLVQFDGIQAAADHLGGDAGLIGLGP